jgi:hypothetical protein
MSEIDCPYINELRANVQSRDDKDYKFVMDDIRMLSASIVSLHDYVVELTAEVERLSSALPSAGERADSK